jgi:hypothetical protein
MNETGTWFESVSKIDGALLPLGYSVMSFKPIVSGLKLTLTEIEPTDPPRNDREGEAEKPQKITLGEKNAKALSFFLERVTFETAYRHAHGETEEERKNMAYAILTALKDIELRLFFQDGR